VKYFLKLVFLGKVVSNQHVKQVSEEVFGTLVTGTFNMKNILKLVNDRFKNGSFAQHDDIGNGR